MTKKQWAILGSLLLFVIIVVAFGVSQKKKPAEKQPVKQETTVDVSATGTKRVEFVAEVPRDATTTKPQAQYDAPGGGGNIFGVYDIGISKTGFSQTNLTVKKGDFVKVKVTGVDGEYDFSIPQYGTYILVKKGETKEVTFIPDTVGTFLFECRDMCPDGNKISGKFIVLPK